MTFPPLPEPYTLAQRAASKLARTLPGDDLTPIIEALQEYIAPVLAERDALKANLKTAMHQFELEEKDNDTLREQVRLLRITMKMIKHDSEFFGPSVLRLHAQKALEATKEGK